MKRHMTVKIIFLALVFLILFIYSAVAGSGGSSENAPPEEPTSINETIEEDIDEEDGANEKQDYLIVETISFQDYLDREYDNLRELIFIFIGIFAIIIVVLSWYLIDQSAQNRKNIDRLFELAERELKHVEREALRIEEIRNKAETIIDDIKEKAESFVEEETQIKFKEFMKKAPQEILELQENITLIEKLVNEKKVDEKVSPELLREVKKKVKKIDSITAESRTDLDYYFLAVEEKDLDKRIMLLTQAINLNPDLFAAYESRGGTYMTMGETNKAIADLKKAIKLKPTDAIAHNNLGWAYNRLKKYDLALVCFQKAIELAPDLHFTYNNLGRTYLKLGKYNLADMNLNKAIELFPNYSTAHKNKACIFALKGEKEKAFKFLEIAANNGYSDIELIRKETELNSLKNDSRFDEILKKIEENARKTE